MGERDRNTSVRNKALAVGLALVASGVGSFAVSSPAQADTKYGCNYPRVCFYRTWDDWWAWNVTASYKDMTSGFQWLGPRSRGAAYVVDSRNDDGALLHFTDGDLYCLTPGDDYAVSEDGEVDGIRIMDDPNCNWLARH